VARKPDPWGMEDVASVGNLFRAAGRARKNKSRRPEVEAWWMRRESEILTLREELLNGTYQPGPYRFFEVHEPKRRLIAAAPFRDRVVHHALCVYLAPALERRFIARSFSCQVGKGTMAARECCRKLTNLYRYVLKCDVRKFYPNIDQAILRSKLANHIGCPAVMVLVDRILDSYRTDESLACSIFPGDDWVEAARRPRGLPIGNLTSQLWGNFYLDAMDHVVTEGEAHGAYIRYTDDFLLFGNDKARLWEMRDCIVHELARVRLKLALPKSRLMQTREGVPFCGFRFLPGLRPRILGATKRRFECRRHYLFETGRPWSEVSVSIFSWYQFSREGNSEGLRRAYSRWPFDPRLRRRRRRTSRVLRGGSWNNNESRNLLSSYRNNNHPDNRNDNNGFRVVLGVSSP
jgi:RNA-directed DNA polymerase